MLSRWAAPGWYKRQVRLDNAEREGLNVRCDVQATALLASSALRGAPPQRTFRPSCSALSIRTSGSALCVAFWDAYPSHRVAHRHSLSVGAKIKKWFAPTATFVWFCSGRLQSPSSPSPWVRMGPISGPTLGRGHPGAGHSSLALLPRGAWRKMILYIFIFNTFLV